jgi:hypothetical protein
MIKILSSAAVFGLLIASSSNVFAKGLGGASGASTVSPGYQFRNGSTPPVSGLPGAAGFAPGQQMRAGVVPTAPGNGASVYAPGFLK